MGKHSESEAHRRIKQARDKTAHDLKKHHESQGMSSRDAERKANQQADSAAHATDRKWRGE